MATPFNQGVPSVPVVLNTSNCFVFGNTASGNALSVQQLGTGNVATFRTQTGATALFVNAAGNVGVGTTNPSYQLSVATGLGATATPTVQIADTVGPKSLSVIPNASSGVYNAMVATGDTLLVAGVGTTVNTGVLTLAPWSGSSVGARIGGSSNIFGIYSNATTFYSNAVSPAAAMTLVNGNVGIGNNNPRDILQVQSGSPTTRLTGTTNFTTSAFIFDNRLGNFWHLNGYGNNPTTGARGAAYAAGQIICGSETNNNYENAYMAFQVCFDPQSDGTGGLGVTTERMRIKSNGNVGIGTTNPGYALQVNGSIGMVGGTTIPLTLPLVGSQTSYSINLAASGTWYTVISDARINATITGAIGVSDLTSTIFIATLYANGGANASMVLVTGSASNIRVSGTALQFNANGGLYGRDCNFTLLRHN